MIDKDQQRKLHIAVKSKIMEGLSSPSEDAELIAEIAIDAAICVLNELEKINPAHE